ncbi:MAG: tetratricopeptide repeat protein [Myxococcota bacterium]
MAEEEHRPTVLLVGQGEPMQAALGEALRRHGVSVAASSSDELENAVRVYAPDLVVLIGDASVRGGSNIVQRMAANRATDVLPVAVVSNEAVLKHEGPDFRSGAVAIVPRGAGADTIARRLAELAREVPDRPGVARGDLTEENLKDVVSLVASDHKTGILSIQSRSGVVEGMPMVVETESPSAHNMEVVLDRLREAMDQSEELQYEFHEASGGRLSTLPAPLESIRPGEPADLRTIEGARMVILDSDELRAERFAHVLHARGVKVAAADFSTAVIPRIREVDPQVIVLDSTAVGGRGIEFVRAIRKDPQLRWASILVVRWEDFWPDSSSEGEPDLGQLASRVEPLIEQDADVPRRVADEIDFDTRLELIGPGRLLRALGSVAGVRHVAISSNKRSVEIDIADNSIVGAYATLREDTAQNLQGIPALTALWGMNSGRVSVREQDLPSVANIMMPVDEALGVVARELGMAQGIGAIVGDAPTVPPAAPEVQEQATVPPGAISNEELDELRTMAPPRFRHLQAAAGAEGHAFAEDEAPTNKVPRMLARVETERRAVAPNNGGIRESNGPERHTDHGVGRPGRKATQMGLAPTFEALPDEGAPLANAPGSNAGSGSKTPPPPPLDSRKPSRGPLFADESFEHELAPMLEGPATILAPSQPGSNQAWILVLLLVAVVGGLGFATWQFWLRADSGAIAEAEVERDTLPAAPLPSKEAPDEAPAEAGDTLDADPSGPPEAGNAMPAAPQEERSEAQNDGRAGQHNTAEPPAQPDDGIDAEENPEAAAPSAEPVEPPSKPLDASTRELLIPTQNLPRDPSKASDVLVHRALPLIRKGQLQRAEATLDRAWELDPRNPQAMAGYATLYVAAGDGEAGEKWAKRAVAKRPRRVQYRVLLGDALMLQDRPREARKAWRKALEQDPENRAARSRLKRGAGDPGPSASGDTP